MSWRCIRQRVFVVAKRKGMLIGIPFVQTFMCEIESEQSDHVTTHPQDYTEHEDREHRRDRAVDHCVVMHFTVFLGDAIVDDRASEDRGLTRKSDLTDIRAERELLLPCRLA